ncbi:unnamed protein product [Brugia timori]|uniref:Secreted protein n=1 Tax=Brugia timori TaxID=42155 RepID=A0A0R3QMX0_9BILA|nr:unnamed protein product [Brugia timori]
MHGHSQVIVMIATGLLRALLTFDKQIVRMHLCFDYFALAFNIWAITVLRSCLEFFVLVHVLVELAER